MLALAPSLETAFAERSGEVSRPDFSDFSDLELIGAMRAARRLASRAQAAELAAVAELARRRHAEAARPLTVEAISPSDYLHDEVAEALTLTRASAGDLIRFATELTGRLPATYAALASGEIDYAKARTLWHGMDQLGDEPTASVERAVLERAPGQTTGEIRAKIRRLVRRLDPDAFARRRGAAERRRGVQLVETDAGTAHLTGVDLPADAADAAYGRINAIAAGFKSDGDERAIGQLRADVFLGLLRGTLTTARPPAVSTDGSAGSTDGPIGSAERPAGSIDRPGGSTRRPAAGAAAAPESGWADADDMIADAVANAARTELTQVTRLTQVGQLAGPAGDLPERHRDVGALIAQAGARISASLAGLKTGWCVPGHEGSYRPSAALRRLIEHRDRRCCFPGCRRPVRACDADHSVPFQRGGATCPCNVAMLCRRHHRLKQTNGWEINHLWPGVILWIGPTGHWRITAPADRE